MELLAARFCGYWAFKMFKAKESKPQKENQLSSECKGTFRKFLICKLVGECFAELPLACLVQCPGCSLPVDTTDFWCLPCSPYWSTASLVEKNKLCTSYLVRIFADRQVEQGSKARHSHTAMHTDLLVLILLLIVYSHFLTETSSLTRLTRSVVPAENHHIPRKSESS